MKIIKRKNEEEKCGSISLTYGSTTMWMGLDDVINYMDYINRILPRRHSYATTYTAASYFSITKTTTTTKKKNKDKIPFYDTLNGGNKYFKQKYKK